MRIDGYSIFDNVFNVELETHLLSYDYLAERFTEIYWNLVLNYHLRQEIKTAHHEFTSVEKELFAFCQKYAFDYSEKQNIFPFESLRSDLQLEVSKKIKSQMMKNVVAAFCGDTDDQFYHFNKKDKSEGIFLNPDVYSALVKYKSVFEKQNYYECVKLISPILHTTLICNNSCTKYTIKNTMSFINTLENFQTPKRIDNVTSIAWSKYTKYIKFCLNQLLLINGLYFS